MYGGQGRLRVEGVSVMTGIILKILMVIGILLLVLLGLALGVFLLVLFVPIVYRVSGSMDGEKKELKAKVRWLFGLLIADYCYPEPGRFTVKLLWKTLYDSGQDNKKPKMDHRKKDGKGRAGAKASDGEQNVSESHAEQEAVGTKNSPEPPAASESTSESSESGRNEGQKGTEKGDPASENTDSQKLPDRFQKIKYTIQDKYDKIKDIWENISYYAESLREENTIALWGHAKIRLFKILKSIRPRHVQADILFGADSPDTTGYAFGLYSMLSPYLGTKVCLTPDFTRAVLEGRFAVSGHITTFVILWNALKVLFDKKLHLFIKRMKAGRKKDG